MDLDNLPPLTRLPTTFFPSPSKTFDGQESRIVAIAYDYSNYGDAMIAKSIHSDLLRPNDDIRILYVMNQNDYHNLFTPMLTVYGTNRNYDDSQDAYLRNAVDTFMWEIITVLNKRGVSVFTFFFFFFYTTGINETLVSQCIFRNFERRSKGSHR